jgi:hypothetical protein
VRGEEEKERRDAETQRRRERKKRTSLLFFAPLRLCASALIVRGARALAQPLLLGISACGYHLGPAPVDPLGPFTVVATPVRVAEAGLAAAAEEGARAELSRAGQLGGRGAPGAIEVQVIRVDEVSEGIAAGAQGAPLARGVRVAVVGRAVLRGAGGRVARDTGDVRAGEVTAAAPAVAEGVVAADEAGRIAARRLGETLVRRILGVPDPGEP